MEDTAKKAAFVAVIGRPSVGKSTLINRLCGQKVAIVSPVPQTTRNAIRGILTRDEGQLVFIDTPGRHNSERKFNKKLTEVADRAANESDLILYILDAGREPGVEEEAIAGFLSSRQERLIVAVNKIDTAGGDENKVREFLKEQLPELPESRCAGISALEGTGIDGLLALLFDAAPAGEPFYPPDYYTDQEVSFRVGEIIREKAMNRLRQELPHSLYVDVADLELKDEGTRLWIRAFIVVERESQKGMVVGKGGDMIKAIRQAAQKDLKRIFEWKIDLDLRVKTGHEWRHNDKVLRRIIEG